MAVDLHTHTNHSDGTLSPKDLVYLASSQGLKALAVTDHDITTANEEAIKTGMQIGVEIVPGVELSAEYSLPGNGHLDILGLFIDFEHPELNQSLQYLRKERAKRSEKILDRLSEIGIRIPLSEVQSEAGAGSLGRPHIARVMMKHGYVETVNQAFQKYLKNGAPAFVDKQKLPASESIDLIIKAGGIAIIAHPFSLGFNTYRDFGNTFLALKALGLQGIEAYYPNYSVSMSRWLRTFAAENDLLISGGSDFHGSVKPDIQLGSGSGNLHVPDEVYEKLLAYHQSLHI